LLLLLLLLPPPSLLLPESECGGKHPDVSGHSAPVLLPCTLHSFSLLFPLALYSLDI
jgi:hypothetical protein